MKNRPRRDSSAKRFIKEGSRYYYGKLLLRVLVGSLTLLLLQSMVFESHPESVEKVDYLESHSIDDEINYHERNIVDDEVMDAINDIETTSVDGESIDDGEAFQDDDQTDDSNQENEELFDPVSVSDGKSYIPPAQVFPYKMKTFSYVKSSECKYLCKSLKSAGWQSASSVYPKSPEVVVSSYKQVSEFAHLKKAILNQVGRGSSCIGGGKGKQLHCRETFAQDNGCEFGDLGLQPRQWNIQETSTCKVFMEFASQAEHAESIWIVKPGGSFHGSGIKLYKGISKIHKIYPCTSKLNDGMIVQKYIDNPALIDGYKFDFRSYLLIASINPFIAFYHDGFVRKSSHLYDTSESSLNDASKHVTNARGQEKAANHFYNFQDLQNIMHNQSGFQEDLLEAKFRPHAKRVSNFLANSYIRMSKKYGANKYPRFQIFALDWVMDNKGGFHLLEANGNPQLSSYPIDDFAPMVWTSMYELVHKIQAQPDTLSGDFSVASNYIFDGRWHMVYNELEEADYGEAYNPCKNAEYVASKHPLYSFEN